MSNRNHCIIYSDWSSVPNAELGQGIRFDTNYYYWPDAWVRDRPGFFTGSGFPQRFAETNGALIDVYQAATQLTDESGQDIADEVRVLLDNAIGPAGFYGVITANMHTDDPDSPGADAIISAAQARGVPIVSARQMLTWLDGRNASSFQGVAFSGGRLSFSVVQAGGATGLQAMIPASGPTGALQGLTRNGQPVAANTQTIKGITYATFPADAGALRGHVPGARRTAPGRRRRRRRAGLEQDDAEHRDGAGPREDDQGADLPACEAQRAPLPAGSGTGAGDHLPPEADLARGAHLPHDEGQYRPPHPDGEALQGGHRPAAALGRA